MKQDEGRLERRKLKKNGENLMRRGSKGHQRRVWIENKCNLTYNVYQPDSFFKCISLSVTYTLHLLF